MVLPPSPADAGAGEAPAWLSRIARLLEVGSGGKVIILVTGARPECLRALVRTLLDVDGELRVLARAPELIEVPPGALVVLAPSQADLAWLNLERPVFSERALRVILWADDALTLAMKARAPDFFDWISHVVWCQERVVDFAVAGLRSGADAYPGIAWRDGDLDAALARAHPDAGIHRASARARYPDLVRAAREAGDRWLVWTDVQDPRDVMRVRWALAEVDRCGHCVLEQPACPTPTWWPVHGSCTPLAEAVARLEPLAGDHAALVAALLDLEPGAIELAARMPIIDAALRERLASADDPGAGLARAALAQGVIDADDVVLDRAPDDATEVAMRAPVLRGFHDDPAIESHRQSLRSRVSEQLTALQAQEMSWPPPSMPDAAEILAWAATRPADPPSLPLVFHARAALAPWIEAVLRTSASAGTEDWSRICDWAIVLGNADASESWKPGYSEAPNMEIYLVAMAIPLGLIATRNAAQGRYTEAEALYRQALAIMQPAPGESAHLTLVSIHHALGRVLNAAKRYDEAEQSLRQARVMATEVHGSRANPVVADILRDLGMALSMQGRNAEAEEVLREAIAVVQQVHGKRMHVSMLDPLADWGAALHLQGRFAEAEAAFREVLAIADGLGLAVVHEQARRSRSALGATLLAQDRAKEARDVLRPAWENPASHDHAAWAIELGELLAMAMERSGDVEGARVVRAQIEALQ